MAKKDEKISQELIRVEITQSKPYGFYISDLEEVSQDKIELKNLQFLLNANSATNKDAKSIKIELEVDAVLRKEEDEANEEKVFGIKSTTIFKTPDFDDIIDEKGEISAPKEFLIKLMNISIGGIRGMLAVYLLNTALNHITLPLFDLSSLKK